MEEQSSSSVESWVLMSLIYRDLDDGDYNNALLLSERLYAIDSDNVHYKYLYASCSFHCLDYTASYSILRAVKSVPCLNLFAKSCLELGNVEESTESSGQIWEEGVQSLLLALSLNESPKKMYWGDELSSITTRNHMPSKSSIYNLLGDLYVKLDNVKAASMAYFECLKLNQFKISAYMKLCDIAPDCVNLDKATFPEDIFDGFNSLTDLSKSPNPYLPVPPSTEVSEISFLKELSLDEVKKNSFSMPGVLCDYQDATVEQLRALVRFAPNILEEDSILLKNQYKRDDIENTKSGIIEDIAVDISQMTANEAYKNKHGLHKKPPTQTTQNIRVELLQDENEVNTSNDKMYHDSIKSSTPPRLSPLKSSGSSEHHLAKKIKLAPHKIIKHTPVSVANFFVPTTNIQFNLHEHSSYIIKGMNKVVKALSILARGYFFQSFYHCEKAALELQKFDDNQYNSPRVLCILGKAYYDAGDHHSARILYKHAFLIAPWYCEGVPYYSTCLWYLSKEQELNLLAYKLKNNKSHLYEAYIAAGNWSKCAKGGNEATQWFEKAVKLEPSRSYGHALLGYEEWEKGNSLGAKQHFSRSMITNKRSYIGWYGMAATYQTMQEYSQAKTLLLEAVRLHPRHPVVLYTFAEVLFELEEFEAAKVYLDRSLSIKMSASNEKLREKIEARVQNLNNDL